MTTSLDDKELLWDERMWDYLLNLARLFRSRFFPVHQAHMRTFPSELYNLLAQVLGAARFPEEVSFRRHNALFGERTDLCRNASLVRKLQRRLSADYDTV